MSGDKQDGEEPSSFMQRRAAQVGFANAMKDDKTLECVKSAILNIIVYKKYSKESSVPMEGIDVLHSKAVFRVLEQEILKFIDQQQSREDSKTLFQKQEILLYKFVQDVSNLNEILDEQEDKSEFMKSALDPLLLEIFLHMSQGKQAYQSAGLTVEDVKKELSDFAVVWKENGLSELFLEHVQGKHIGTVRG